MDKLGKKKVITIKIKNLRNISFKFFLLRNILLDYK